jgi:hypothetical protein
MVSPEFPGSNVPYVLEAAHVPRFNGRQSNSCTKGLLLRADIHRLLDAHQVAINTLTGKIEFADEIVRSLYRETIDYTRFREAIKAASKILGLEYKQELIRNVDKHFAEFCRVDRRKK